MIITALVFIAVLSILILVHELGHFTAAKRMGIKVEEFGFGLPPRIFGIKKGETVYSLNWLPIGGFVKLYGEEGEIEEEKKQNIDTSRAFYTRPVWQRGIVLLGGVSMNFVLAVSIISFLFTQGMMVPTDRVHIEKIISGSPAEIVGLKEKDTIKKIKTSKEIDIKTGDQLINVTKEHLGEEITLVIIREGQEYEISIVPRENYPQDQGPMGIVISTYEEKKYSLWQAPVLGTKESVILSWELAKGVGKTLWKLISFQPVSKDVAGPVGIAVMTNEVVKLGGRAILELIGLLSLNLAIVNVLPFPALDGGRLVFLVIEGVTGRKIRTHWERYVHQAGMMVLIILMVLVTVNDLVRILGK